MENTNMESLRNTRKRFRIFPNTFSDVGYMVLAPYFQRPMGDWWVMLSISFWSSLLPASFPGTSSRLSQPGNVNMLFLKNHSLTEIFIVKAFTTIINVIIIILIIKIIMWQAKKTLIVIVQYLKQSSVSRIRSASLS